MDIDDNTDYAEKLNSEEDEFGILRDVLMLIPEERLDEVKTFLFVKKQKRYLSHPTKW